MDRPPAALQIRRAASKMRFALFLSNRYPSWNNSSRAKHIRHICGRNIRLATKVCIFIDRFNRGHKIIDRDVGPNV
jgi:hypothetical protein